MNCLEAMFILGVEKDTISCLEIKHDTFTSILACTFAGTFYAIASDR